MLPLPGIPGVPSLPPLDFSSRSQASANVSTPISVGGLTVGASSSIMPLLAIAAGAWFLLR